MATVKIFCGHENRIDHTYTLHTVYTRCMVKTHAHDDNIPAMAHDSTILANALHKSNCDIFKCEFFRGGVLQLTAKIPKAD